MFARICCSLMFRVFFRVMLTSSGNEVLRLDGTDCVCENILMVVISFEITALALPFESGYMSCLSYHYVYLI